MNYMFFIVSIFVKYQTIYYIILKRKTIIKLIKFLDFYFRYNGKKYYTTYYITVEMFLI